ncbi:MAG: metalloregulator ArsR/SmtB family transcription factor [Chloroflexota bacterium]
MDDLLRAIADPCRRQILELVQAEERSSGDIAAQFKKMSQSAVSQHLRVLQKAGLVQVRRAGTRRYYRLSSEGMERTVVSSDSGVIVKPTL